MASITVQVALMLALFSAYAGGQCRNNWANGGLGLLAKIYERVNNLEMEIKDATDQLNSCGCGREVSTAKAGYDCSCDYDKRLVCGRDGQNYPNSCQADYVCGGPGVAYEGKCGCVCSSIEAPVCAENDQTYPNACEAECRGLAVVKNSPCA